MRWLAISWLLFSSMIFISGPFWVATDSSYFITMLESAEEAFSPGPHDTAREAIARNQLHQVVSEFYSMNDSHWTTVANGVSIWAGLVAFYASILLIARKQNGVRFGLIALGALLIVTVSSTLLHELHYQDKVNSMLQKTFEAIAVLSGNPMDFDLKPKRGLMPLPVTGCTAIGIDLALFVLLLRKRKTILAARTPEQADPVENLRPAKALHCVTMNR